jgi:hypothetical protein
MNNVYSFDSRSIQYKILHIRTQKQLSSFAMSREECPEWSL